MPILHMVLVLLPWICLTDMFVVASFIEEKNPRNVLKIELIFSTLPVPQYMPSAFDFVFNFSFILILNILNI